jgi:hypothetical protein
MHAAMSVLDRCARTRWRRGAYRPQQKKAAKRPVAEKAASGGRPEGPTDGMALADDVPAE